MRSHQAATVLDEQLWGSKKPGRTDRGNRAISPQTAARDQVGIPGPITTGFARASGTRRSVFLLALVKIAVMLDAGYAQALHA